MPVTPTPKPPRPWRVVAEEASREYDPERMAELMQELSQALGQQGIANSGELPQKKLA